MPASSACARQAGGGCGRGAADGGTGGRRAGAQGEDPFGEWFGQGETQAGESRWPVRRAESHHLRKVEQPRQAALARYRFHQAGSARLLRHRLAGDGAACHRPAAQPRPRAERHWRPFLLPEARHAGHARDDPPDPRQGWRGTALHPRFRRAGGAGPARHGRDSPLGRDGRSGRNAGPDHLRSRSGSGRAAGTRPRGGADRSRPPERDRLRQPAQDLGREGLSRRDAAEGSRRLGPGERLRTRFRPGPGRQRAGALHRDAVEEGAQGQDLRRLPAQWPRLDRDRALFDPRPPRRAGGDADRLGRSGDHRARRLQRRAVLRDGPPADLWAGFFDSARPLTGKG